MEGGDQGRVRLADAKLRRACGKRAQKGSADESPSRRARIDEQRPKRASAVAQDEPPSRRARQDARPAAAGQSPDPPAMIEVNGEMQPHDPEDWASLELYSILCKLGAMESEAQEAVNRKAPRHMQGRWDIGTAILLDLREGYDSRSTTSPTPTTASWRGDPWAHRSSRNRENECIANNVLLCCLFQEQADKGRWCVHEQSTDNALWGVWAIGDLLSRPGVHGAAPPRARDRLDTGYITNAAELS